MLILITGLILFLGSHSLRLVAPRYREQFIARFGANLWKLAYSIVALGGLALIIRGYDISRSNPVFIYNPALWTKHLALLLTWLTFILLAAGLVPNNQIRARLGHPMYAAIKVWAFAHLLANGRLGDIVLFGALMLWAVAGFSIRRRQDRHNKVIAAPGHLSGTLLTLIAGSVAWGIFAFWLHFWLIGVSPLPF